MAFKITFQKSGKTFDWESSSNNVLDFAEDKGIQMESGCRMGVCGSCKVKLLSGSVTMETEDGLEDADKADRMILPCVAVPESDLVIDA
ncbi:MAG: 2Fe-2S iron-sulfur cluster-binding protein [Deltaproteobacteria bacterium]|jgi:ferredoxin|nr:2Fe-2S iron-sulfur cluster-binding protein [Deltaproteobacteria bacterium]